MSHKSNLMEFIGSDELIHAFWTWMENATDLDSLTINRLMESEPGTDDYDDSLKLFYHWSRWRSIEAERTKGKQYFGGPADGIATIPEDYLSTAIAFEYSESCEAVYHLHECGNFLFCEFRKIADPAVYRKSWRAD